MSFRMFHEYVERIKRHYKLFREIIDGRKGEG